MSILLIGFLALVASFFISEEEVSKRLTFAAVYAAIGGVTLVAVLWLAMTMQRKAEVEAGYTTLPNAYRVSNWWIRLAIA